MVPPRAVIFDLDGVLFLSSGVHEQAYRQALAEVGISTFSYAAIAGMRTEEAMVRLLAENDQLSSPDRIASLTQKKRDRAAALLAERPPVVPHCQELLEWLHVRCRLALASSSSRRNVQTFLEASGTKALFETIVCGEEVGRAKPNPEIYQSVLAQLGLPAEQCLVVEDAPQGVAAAVAAGIPVVGMEGLCDRAELLHAGCDGVIAQLNELRTWVSA